MAVLGQASLGTMRVNAARLRFHNPGLHVTIGGTDRSAKVRRDGLAIQSSINSTPDTAAIRVSGFTPAVGQDVRVASGSSAGTSLVFAGTAQRLTQVFEGQQAHVAYDLDCVDYAWQMDRRLVFGSFTNQSASTIATSLMASFAAGYTTTRVQQGLPAVSVTFPGIPLSDALTQLAQLVGATWKVSYTKDLRFSTFSQYAPTPDTVTAANATMDAGVTPLTDLSQVRTRVYVAGKSTTTAGAAAAGATSLSVLDTSAFAPGGGSALADDWLIFTYTGVGSSSALAAPSAPTANLAYYDGANAVTITTTSYPGGGSIFTVTCASAHGLSVGQGVLITWNDPSANGCWRVAGVSSGTVFTVDSGSTRTAVTNGGGWVRPCFNVSFSTFGGVCTATTTQAHGFTVGMTVQVLYTSPTLYNGWQTVTGVPSATTFTFALSGHPADSAAINSAGFTAPAGCLAASSGALVGTYSYKVSLAGNSAETLASTASGSVTAAGVANFNAAGTATGSTGGGSLTTSGVYNWGVTLVTATGETTPGTLVQVTLTSQHTVTLDFTASLFLDPRVLSINIWRTAANAAATVANLRYVGSLAVNLTLTAQSFIVFTDGIADTALGGRCPTVNTTGGAIAVSALATSTDTRVGTRNTYRTAAGGGTYSQIATVNDNSTASTTDGAADTALGTGEPTAATPFPGTLTGVSGLTAALVSGAAVALWVQRDDTTAQTALAAIEGGDGIHEDRIDDDTLASVAACNAAGDAALTLFKAPEQKATFTSRDDKLEVGATANVVIGSPTNLMASEIVQAVTISQLGLPGGPPYTYPLRTVEIGSTRYTLQDLLRQVALEG